MMGGDIEGFAAFFAYISINPLELCRSDRQNSSSNDDPQTEPKSWDPSQS